MRYEYSLVSYWHNKGWSPDPVSVLAKEIVGHFPEGKNVSLVELLAVAGDKGWSLKASVDGYLVFGREKVDPMAPAHKR